MSEVVVVGGGPAGLAAAIALRTLDLEVRLLERRQPGAEGALDKVCGEGLMPDGVAHLEALGVEAARLGGRPFCGIRYLDEAGVAQGHFARGRGLGVRRTALHRALVECAQERGVALEWGRCVDGLFDCPRGNAFGLVSGGERLAPRFVVAADGLRSPLRHAAGLARPAHELAPRFGLRRHFEIEPWCDRVEVYWAVGAEAYVTPLSERLVGVAILWRPAKEGPEEQMHDGRVVSLFERLLSRFPGLASRLRDAPAVTPARGVGPLRQSVARRARRNLFLVGDAAGYRDAITGEGMSIAFHQAHALRRALAHGPDTRAGRRYDRAARRLERLPGHLTELVLVLAGRPALRRRVVAALSRQPRYFDRLLAVHAREVPVRELGLGTTMRFMLELLRPSDSPAHAPCDTRR